MFPPELYRETLLCCSVKSLNSVRNINRFFRNMVDNKEFCKNYIGGSLSKEFFSTESPELQDCLLNHRMFSEVRFNERDPELISHSTFDKIVTEVPEYITYDVLKSVDDFWTKLNLSEKFWDYLLPHMLGPNIYSTLIHMAEELPHILQEFSGFLKYNHLYADIQFHNRYMKTFTHITDYYQAHHMNDDQ